MKTTFEARLAKIEATKAAQQITYSHTRGNTALYADEVMDACIALVYGDQDSEQAQILLSATDASDGSDLHGLLQMLVGADGKLRRLANRRDYSWQNERRDRALEPAHWPRVRMFTNS